MGPQDIVFLKGPVSEAKRLVGHCQKTKILCRTALDDKKNEVVVLKNRLTLALTDLGIGVKRPNYNVTSSSTTTNISERNTVSLYQWLLHWYKRSLSSKNTMKRRNKIVLSTKLGSGRSLESG